MARWNENNVTIENAQLVFRNFSGKEGQYNRAGDRNFAVLLDEETARKMLEDGWNVKYLKPREEGDSLQAYLTVAVSYKGKPPRAVLISSRGRTPLDEESIELLDWVDIEIADVIVRPYEWLVNGKGGVKAYLKTIFVTADEDELERKYAEDNISRDD